MSGKIVKVGDYVTTRDSARVRKVVSVDTDCFGIDVITLQDICGATSITDQFNIDIVADDGFEDRNPEFVKMFKAA